VYVMSMGSSSILAVVACGSVVGWGTMLQAGRSRDRAPLRWIFFNWLNPSATLWPWGRLSLTEMSNRNFPGGVKGGWCVGLTTLAPSVSRLSRQNVGAWTSRNPLGLHGLLRG
jgi:hypothetical protein